MMTTGRHGTPTRRREAGRIVTMVPLASLAALIAIGVGIDFTGQAQAEQELRDIVAQCARAGASQITIAQAAIGLPSIQSARACLDRVGATGTVTLAEAGGVAVLADGEYDTKLLTLIGIGHLPLHAEAEAAVSARR